MLRRGLALVATLAAVAYLAYWVREAVLAEPIDLLVYRGGARAVLDGAPLYEGPVSSTLRFTYPPFAALVFTPTTLVTPAVAGALLALANAALLLLAVWRSWRAVDPARGAVLAVLVVLSSALLLAPEALRITFLVGQVNLLLLVLVLVDLLRGRTRTLGVGVGLAAGLKLTPLVFVGYLVVTRRYRAAAVATGTFAATVALGFAVLPRDATRYWLGGALGDVGRIYPDPASTHNKSLRGLLLRAGTPDGLVTPLWLALGAVLGLLTLGLAALAHRRGEELLGLTLCGLVAAALTPWTWGHHWVWVLPLGVHLASLLRRGGGPRATLLRVLPWVPAAVLLVLTLPRFVYLVDWPVDDGTRPRYASGPVALVLGNAHLLLLLAVLAATAAVLGRPRVPVAPPPATLVRRG